MRNLIAAIAMILTLPSCKDEASQASLDIEEAFVEVMNVEDTTAEEEQSDLETMSELPLPEEIFPEIEIAESVDTLEVSIEDIGFDVEKNDDVKDEVAVEDVSNLSENAAACLYVVTSLCSKILTKCDVFHLLPEQWMDSCTQFLLNNDDTIALACSQLDNAQSTDPTVSLILSFGPTALQNCVDNFQCTLENVLEIVNFVKPLFSGAKVDTATILNLVVKLCF